MHRFDQNVLLLEKDPLVDDQNFLRQGHISFFTNIEWKKSLFNE